MLGRLVPGLYIPIFFGVTLGDLVAELHDLIIEQFVEDARRQAEQAGLDRVELVDSMSFFIDDLIESLATGVRLDPRLSAAASHGVERLSVGFRIDRVVREYVLLAEIVLDLAHEHAVLTTRAELRVLIQAVGDGAAIAATEYVRRREADLLHRESEHAAFLAHEVRNSLASARFAFNLLKRRDIADSAPLITIVDNSLRQAGARIDDALAGARVRGGVVSPMRVFAKLMLEEIAAQLRPQAQARSIVIAVEAPDDLHVQADARLLRSALENLVSNGVKFSRAGGSVTLRALVRGDNALFEIADECGGIDEGQIDRLFRPFVQAGEERSGFGVGLAIARECAEAQGGALHLANMPGKGCVFTVTVPMHP
jgi:signal transduction histidine kinase